jgi:hypothetical protein
MGGRIRTQHVCTYTYTHTLRVVLIDFTSLFRSKNYIGVNEGVLIWTFNIYII